MCRSFIRKAEANEYHVPVSPFQAVAIILDAKTDYPSACNACETVLFHESTLSGRILNEVLQSLRQAGVTLKAGPNAISLGVLSAADAAASMSVEYGSLTCLIEVVKDIGAALDHIHAHGSGHTEAIITEEFVSSKYLICITYACRCSPPTYGRRRPL